MHRRVYDSLDWQRSEVWSVVAERSSALDSSSGVVRMWVRIPAWPVAALVSLSKTLNHNCFVLRMVRKAVGPVCCVMHVNRTRDTYREREGACPGVSGFAPWAPNRVDMCALQIFCIIIRLLLFVLLNVVTLILQHELLEKRFLSQTNIWIKSFDPDS